MLLTVISWGLNCLCPVINGMQMAKRKWPVMLGELASRHPIRSRGWEVNHNWLEVRQIRRCCEWDWRKGRFAGITHALCFIFFNMLRSFCLQFRLLHPDPLWCGKVRPAGQTTASKSQSLWLRDAPAGRRSADPVQTEEEPAWNVTWHW